MGEKDTSVQSENDQGAEDSGFYQEYLTDKVPEDYRPHVEPYLRDIERNANQKFAEHSDYRKQWEPYEELGLNEIEPESIQQLLEFAELANDEDQFKQWLTNAVEKTGLLNELVPDNDDESDDEDDEPAVDINAITEAVSNIIEERFKPFEQREQDNERKEQVSEANKAIDTRVEELKKEHGEFDEQTLYRFAYIYSDSHDGVEAINKGFEDMQKLIADTERGTVQRKLNQPRPAPGGALPNTNGEAPKTFADAKEMAKERFAQNR